MERTSGQYQHKKMVSTQTFFTSNFYDFNQDESQTEDFDISKQYLKSQISENKSYILRQISQEHFINAIRLYYKIQFAFSFINWREKVGILIKKQKLQPKVMTKIFIKMFYSLNKKLRSMQQKAFVKISNFTKEFEMKNYDPPVKVGVIQLSEWIQTINAKYFYINTQQLMRSSFQQIKLKYIIKNGQAQLNSFFNLLESWSKFILLQTINRKQISLIEQKQKIQILFGTISLVTNPLLRHFFTKTKTNNIFEQTYLQKYHKQIQEAYFNSDYLSRQQKYSSRESFTFQNQKNFNITLSKQQKINQFTKPQNEKQFVSKLQNTKQLVFSKQLKRKSSKSFEKLNRLKFKAIPGIQSGKKSNKFISDKEIINIQQQHKHNKNINIQIKQKCKINQTKPLLINRNAFRYNQIQNCEQIPLQIGKIQCKKQIKVDQFKISRLRNEQFIQSVPNCSNFSTFPQISTQQIKQQIYQLKKAISSQNKLKIFKTIKSGKHINPYEQDMKMSQSNHNPTRVSVKFTYKAQPNIQPIQNELTSKQSRKDVYLIDASPRKKQYYSPRNQKILSFKSAPRIKFIKNQNLQILRNEYNLPVYPFQQINNYKESPFTAEHNYINDLYFHQQKFYIQDSPKRRLIHQNSRNSSHSSHSAHNEKLVFKLKKPMQSVKSANSKFNINKEKVQSKKKIEKQPEAKLKKQKELKSNEFNHKYERFSTQHSTQNTGVISNQSSTKRIGPKHVKSNSQSQRKNSQGISITKK